MTSRSERMPATRPPSVTGTAPMRRSASKATASRTIASMPMLATSLPLRSRIAARVMAGSFFPRLGLNHPMGAAQMEAMPRHDPIPFRRDPRALERQHRAWLRYKRMMRWMALVALAAVIAALGYLKATGTPMPLHMVIATSLGVFLTILLGTGLMGLVFLSDTAGHDEAASGRSDFQ